MVERTQNMARKAAFLVLFVVLLASFVFADVKTINGVATNVSDAWVLENNGGYNGGSDTGGQLGPGNSATKDTRVFINSSLLCSSFDPSTDFQKMVFSLYTKNNVGSPADINIHQITSNWKETGVTWSAQPTYNSTPINTTSYTGNNRYHNFTLPGYSVNQNCWDSTNYFGWILVSSAENSGSNQNFQVRFSENTNVSVQPQFHFYTAGGAPPATADSVEFLPNTPADETKNNTQVNIKWNSSSGYADFYFGTSNPPTTQYFYNVSTGVDGYNWTTNVTADNTYYYFASVAGNTSLNTSVRSWIYDTTSPTISIGGDKWVNSSNATNNVYRDYIIINYSLSDAQDLFGTSVNITHYLTNVSYYSYFNESLSGSPTATIINNVSTSSWPVGHYLVEIFASDSHTDTRIKDYSVRKEGISTFKFDTDEGYTVKVRSDDAAILEYEKKVDRYEFSYEFKDRYIKDRVFHVESASGVKYLPDSPYKAHFVVGTPRGGNWIDFEGIKGEPTIRRISRTHYTVTFPSISGGEEIKFRSIGGLNTNGLTLNLTKSSLSLDTVQISPLQASGDDDLIGQCRATEGLGFDVDFDWSWYVNDSLHSSGTATSQSSNTTISLSTISSTTTSNGDNWTFSCDASATTQGSASTGYTNSSYTNVVSVVVTACGLSPSAVYPILNMTYFDEDTDSAITLSNGLDLAISDGINFYNYTKVFSGNVSDSLCTNVNPSNRTYHFDAWGTFNLQKSGYATRLYEIPQAEAINITNNPTYSLPLYLIGLNDSSTVNYEWLTTGFQPIDGIMRVYKCELDGTKSLVESSPITDGGAVANIELLNTPYSYEVFTGGVTYSDEDSYSKCHLESETDITYYVDISQTDYSGVIGLYDVQCYMQQSGQVITFNWSTNPQDSSAITGCLLGYRGQVTGNSLVYENCTSSAFSITRTIPNNTYSYYVKGKLYQGGYSIECSDVAFFPATTSAQQSFGLTAVFGVIILFIALVLIYSGQGETSLIAGGIGIVVAWLLGMLAVPWEVVTSIIAILVLIAAVGRKSR